MCMCVVYMCIWILTGVHTCVWIYIHVCLCSGPKIDVRYASWFLLLYFLRQVLLPNPGLAIMSSLLASLPQYSWAGVSTYWVLRLYVGAIPTCPAQLLCEFWRSAVWSSNMYGKSFIHCASFPTQSHYSEVHKVSFSDKIQSSERAG